MEALKAKRNSEILKLETAAEAMGTGRVWPRKAPVDDRRLERYKPAHRGYTLEVEASMAERMPTQILLEPNEHERLARIADQAGRSVSDIVGGMIRLELERREERDKRLAGIDAIRRMREDILARHGGQPLDIDMASLIEEMRGERDEEIFGRLRSVDR